MNNNYYTSNFSFFFPFSVMLLFLFRAHTLAFWRFSGEIYILLLALSLLLSVFMVVSSISKYDSRQIPVIVLVSCLVLADALVVGGYYGLQLWILFALIIAAKDLSFKKIVKFHLGLELLLCLSNVVAHGLGLTDIAYNFFSDSVRESVWGDVMVRLSLGYPAATDLATHIFYMLLDYWILKDGKFRKKDCILSAVCLFFVMMYCDARQASGCIALILLSSLWIRRMERKQKRIGRILGRLLMLSIPAFFVLCLYIYLSYDESDINWMAADLLLSGRLHLGSDAIQEYGIHWLGQNIEFIGAGFDDVSNEYNYVDCGYIQFLLLWGILIIVISLFTFVKIGVNAYRRNDMVILCALFMAGLSTTITQFIFFPNYCILLFALTATHHENLSDLEDDEAENLEPCRNELPIEYNNLEIIE